MACGTSHPVRRNRLCSKFSYNDIREVHRRRYLLQPIAIEVFSADGRNYLLVFPMRMRNRVYEKFVVWFFLFTHKQKFFRKTGLFICLIDSDKLYLIVCLNCKYTIIDLEFRD